MWGFYAKDVINKKGLTITLALFYSLNLDFCESMMIMIFFAKNHHIVHKNLKNHSSNNYSNTTFSTHLRVAVVIVSI